MSIQTSPGIRYEEKVAMPMRDGVLLRANIWRPAREGRFPAIFERTPYSKAAGLDNLFALRFVLAGYAYIAQDIRGRYDSDGVWIPFSEPDTGDDRDGFDSIEWLVRQPWCDGKIGTTGASYNGWLQWQTARRNPPGLAAMSARSIPVEMPDLDWGGSFKVARRFRWWFVSMAPDIRKRLGLPPPHTTLEAARPPESEAEQKRRMETLPLGAVPAELPPGLAEAALAWMRDPGRRPWKLDAAHRSLSAPNFDITGWFDHCNGSIGHFAGMRAAGATPQARAQTRLIIGPWNHMGIGRRKQGSFDFGPAAEVDGGGLVLRWFDRWIKNEDNGVDREPAVRYFVLGSNEWKAADDWPPPGVRARTLFLRSAPAPAAPLTGHLDSRPPAGDEAADSFTDDPRNPCPSQCDSSLFTQPIDRNLLNGRSDILRYVSAPLEEDLEIAGHPEVILHAASTAPDTDLFARLSDDEAGGRSLEICYGMVRARYRQGLDREIPLTPGEPAVFRIRLGPTACRFLQGHRIRLDIAAADFPLHDRNHHTGGNDLFESKLVTATQTVFHSVGRPSCLILPVTG